MKNRLQFIQAFAILVLSFALLTGCGGGGGGGGFSGAGNASISTRPDSIDIGDRTKVTIDISSVNEDGIIVKVKFPEGLTYVPDTSILTVDDDRNDIGPDISVINNDDDRFLVFFFTEDDFDRDGNGKLEFELKGNEVVKNGSVEVDIDVDDPNIANGSEFDPEDPQFQEEDTAYIEVID